MIFVAVSVVVALLLALFAFLFRALLSRPSQSAFSLEWLDEFSVDAYAPMSRLLDRRDVAFLTSQAGYQPEIGKRLMAERRKVFRGYLRLLIADFNRLIALGKLMLVYSTEDRPELAKALWRQQSSFYFAVCRIYCELALYPLGFTVDTRHALEPLRAMREQIQAISARRLAFAELA